VTTHPTARTLLAGVLLLYCTLTISAAPAKHAFVPDPEAEGAALLSGSTWIGLGPGFTLRVQRIDEAQRLAFIEKTTGLRTDPFAAPPGKEPRFVTFIAQLENNGAGGLVFRGDQCWLVTNKNEHLNPLGLESLAAAYSVMGGEMSPAYKVTAGAFLPDSRTLQPGESIAGLLVYNMFKPGTKKFELDIQITTPSGDVVSVGAPYKRVKLEKGEK
jgi:hypothetical protein